MVQQTLQYLFPGSDTDGRSRGKDTTVDPQGTSRGDITIFRSDMRSREICLQAHTPFIQLPDHRNRIFCFYHYSGKILQDVNISAPAADSNFFNAIFVRVAWQTIKEMLMAQEDMYLVNVIILQSTVHSLIANKLSQYSSPLLSETLLAMFI